MEGGWTLPRSSAALVRTTWSPGRASPHELPPRPRAWDVRLTQLGRLPGGAAVEAHVDTADAPDRGPREAANSMRARDERRRPRQRNRALDGLLSEHHLARVVRAVQHVRA